MTRITLRLLLSLFGALVICTPARAGEQPAAPGSEAARPVIVGGGKLVSASAGAVRGVVVSDQDVDVRRGCPQPTGDHVDVLDLVVGGDDNGGSHGRAA